jgi:hypothetical protein
MFHFAEDSEKGLESKRGDPRLFFRRHTRPLGILIQEEFIGGFYYSLANLGCLASTLVGSEERKAPFLYSLGVIP